MASIGQAFKYPFSNMKRFFNFFWIIVPIWGWFVVGGWALRIINEIRNGNSKEVPAIRPWEGLFSTGFFFIVFSLIISIVMQVLIWIPILGWIGYLYIAIISPALMMQFAKNVKFGEGLNIVEATKTTFKNFGSWILTLLKVILVTAVFLIASIPVVTLIITLPAMTYAQYLLWADWYREVTS